MEKLVGAGARLDCRDASGRTPLHHVVRDPGMAERCMEVLMEWGADVLVGDDEGVTPLILALGSWRGTEEVLVRRGVWGVGTEV